MDRDEERAGRREGAREDHPREGREEDLRGREDLSESARRSSGSSAPKKSLGLVRASAKPVR